jgi:septal ring factor EnvC (AmiA/AmiB activator)
MLESTYNKLVEQVLDSDCRADEREQLEQLIATQGETLLQLRNKLRKIETRYEQSVKEISVSKKENKQLHTMLDQLKTNLSKVFDQHQSAKREADRLRQVIRNQELTHTQLINEYENLRSEYEALYRNLST